MTEKKNISSSELKLIEYNTKDIIKTKPITKPKPKTEHGPEAKLRHSIYSRIKFECKECHAEFKNKKALTIHSCSHNRKYLENTEYFSTNSSQNMKDIYIYIYITDKAGNYIEDIDEAINNSLEKKTVISLEKLRVRNIRSHPGVSTRREPKKKLKLLKYSSTLTIF